VNIRDWFRDRRELIADLDRQRDLLAEKDEEVRDTGETIKALMRLNTNARKLASDRSLTIVQLRGERDAAIFEARKYRAAWQSARRRANSIEAAVDLLGRASRARRMEREQVTR
jgi:hypothetical protein